MKAESRLTLKKDDTTLYYLVKCFNDRVCAAAVKQCQIRCRTKAAADFMLCAFCPFEVKRRTGKLDLATDGVKRCGSTNPAFCDIELDLPKGSIPT